MLSTRAEMWTTQQSMDCFTWQFRTVALLIIYDFDVAKREDGLVKVEGDDDLDVLLGA